MDLDRIQEDVLVGLLGGDPDKAEATALRVYSEDAIFKHPFFYAEGRRNIARLWGWWSRMQQYMAPRPGLMQLWIDPKDGPSVVMDLTYEVVPFWAFGPFRRRHVARIVVMLHLEELVEGEEEETTPRATERRPLFKIRRQEDFIQDDSFVSALLPQPFAVPAVLLLRWLMRLWGWCICRILAPLMVEVRAFI